MATPNIGQLLSTTIAEYSPTIRDNVSNNNGLLVRLKSRNNGEMGRPFRGGATIRETLAYAENATYTRYSGLDLLDVSQNDQFDAADFDIKQIAVAVVYSGRQELLNASNEAIYDELAELVKNADRSMMNNMSTDIYSAGTASSGKQITGLQAIVADSGAGIVGSIDSGTWTFWQNQVYDFSANGKVASNTTILSAMNELYTSLIRGRDQTDLIIMDNTYWNHFWESQVAVQRHANANSDLAKAGYSTLKFNMADVICDGGFGGSAPSSHAYFLNTNYIGLRSHAKRNFVPLNPDRYATNQDAMVRFVGWAGNMTCAHRGLQGVMID